MPTHIRACAALGLACALAACADAPEPEEPYPFVGTWDCAVDTFTFTNTTFNTGSQTLPILNVARDGRNFTLFFANNDVIALAAVTDTGMTLFSGKSADQLNCRRL